MSCTAKEIPRLFIANTLLEERTKVDRRLMLLEDKKSLYLSCIKELEMFEEELNFKHDLNLRLSEMNKIDTNNVNYLFNVETKLFKKIALYSF